MVHTFLMSDLRDSVGSKDTRLPPVADLSLDTCEWVLPSLEEKIWSPDGFLHRYTIYREREPQAFTCQSAGDYRFHYQYPLNIFRRPRKF